MLDLQDISRDNSGQLIRLSVMINGSPDCSEQLICQFDGRLFVSEDANDLLFIEATPDLESELTEITLKADVAQFGN